MLVFFLIRRQSSEGVLWSGYFRWTRPKASMKERILTIVASLQLSWKCPVLEMFIQKLPQNLQKSELFPDVCKAKCIEVLTQCCSLTIYKEWNRYYRKIYGGCACDNWKPSFLSRLKFNWRTFWRRVTARWYHQWAKNQLSTKQNSENMWFQIARRAIWT